MLKLYGFTIELRRSSKFRVAPQPELNNTAISKPTMRISFVFNLFLVSSLVSGIKNGTRIRLKNMGLVRGKECGDLYLHVRVKG